MMKGYIKKFVICEKCGTEITSNYIKQHTLKCDGKIKVKKEYQKFDYESMKNEDGIYICPFCNKSYTKKGISSHIWRSHAEGKEHNAHKDYIKGTKQAWNKGLTKETDERINKQAEKIIEKYKTGELVGSFVGRTHSKKTLEKLSEIASLNNKGGKCKWFDVNGTNVQGTYEKQIAEKLFELNIEFIKIKTNNHVFKYEKDGKNHSYAPDFYLPEYDIYLEIKGYWWADDERKMRILKEKYNDIKLIVVFGKEKLDYLCKDFLNNIHNFKFWEW